MKTLLFASLLALSILGAKAAPSRFWGIAPDGYSCLMATTDGTSELWGKDREHHITYIGQIQFSAFPGDELADRFGWVKAIDDNGKAKTRL
jgi:hypothetical protein